MNERREVRAIYCTPNGRAGIESVHAQARAAGLRVPDIKIVDDIDRLVPRDAVHQGVVADVAPLEEVFLSDILVAARGVENACVVVLDQVTDPHNVGAILRSASAFGALAVIVQKQHAPDITGTLAKSACGAVEHVPLVREVNLSRTLVTLREAGFFCIGLDERGAYTLAQTKPESGPVALVLGAEGAGLRRLVAESCDALARLPTQGAIASLNVSNAAAVALYACAGEGADRL